MAPAKQGVSLPLAYRLFFLIIEPVSALVGAFYSHYRQMEYLRLLDANSAPVVVPTATSVALSQLANMYLFFALNEAIVLRSATDMRVWKAVLAVLLMADFGHLYSMRGLGMEKYYDVTGWNASDIGNIPWVYFGATLRICFLAGVGL
ncbi:hypothetical protein S7711_07930 [Stachybotrys chartarum IBT 7711]|uniref:DUF7704 domain-containing protein n=1 Tax=Stachybotrys chartarum (strain CBS 109288 / IBT 7711) TaxID=1280523 RepID=A0A084AKR9_STACB|nr:hypothetical protein S7711_07930 [Stachybotrys chartarum IBT 7711]KFA55756.1 hypothetical protein S40293_01868 [Stachybotrys chartarum IBT 40293]